MKMRVHTFSRRAYALLLGLGTSAAVLPVAQATVAVDQIPLTVQQTLAPNVVLMLDDSGSMHWNFMPDLCYLNGVSCSSGGDINGYSVTSDNTNAALINAANNGVYYNPAITYTAPIKADGTSYPNSPGFSGAWVDGFVNTTAKVNLSLYAPSSSYSSSNYYYDGAYEWYKPRTGAIGSGHSNLAFSTRTSSTYTVTISKTGSAFTSTQCTNLYNADPSRTSTSPTRTTSSPYRCSWSAYYHYFQYSTGAANGPHTRHYVASTNPSCTEVTNSGAWNGSWSCVQNTTNSGCGSQSSCVAETDTSGTSAPSGVAVGQNVANWFSYYRTRILTAKTGLTVAFNEIDPTTRFGFGSIDGNNIDGLPSAKYSYTDSYNNQTNYVATVQPFDDTCVVDLLNPCTPGQSGTQRANFWSWLVGTDAGGGTPLRQALNAVGQYYSSAGPWETSSNDTTALACRQAYTILTTDGFWNDSVSVSNYDGTNGSQITGPNGQTYTYTAAAPYSDNRSNTLADVAMRYWRNDLRTSLANEVPISTEDPAFWQHMVTFAIGLGFAPTGIQPSGTTVDQIFDWANGGSSINNFSWPAPSSDSINNIADLAHAAVNGHGGFYSAQSPQAFSSGLADALKRVQERVGTGASLAANSTTLQTGTVTYQALFYTGKWKGDLLAYAVNSSTGAISATASWSAASALPAAGSRNIKTFPGSGTSMIAFTTGNLTSLSSAQQSALGGNSTERQNRINYLRGDDSNEQKHNGSYRNRDTALGDIVNSQPVYVGAPNPNLFYGKNFAGSDDYTDFAADQLSRSPRIWVAANDGMLHAFNASTGAETFAYLPGAVITNGVASLSDPDYGSTSVPHRFYNDGQLTVADAFLGNEWKTVVVGTTGRGPSKTIYALDITNPSSPAFLWERSAGDGLTNSGYIGQIVGQPIIAQTGDGVWSVLVGNGYNSAQNKAALLQFDLSDGSLSVHATDDTTNNGLAAPAVWQSDPTDGISTVAYAGDLYGNVWSFSLSSANSTGTKLYTATDGATAQPITGGMLTGKDPDSGDRWLFFGTGRYLTQPDLEDTSTQTWYGLIIELGSNHGSEVAVTSSSTRSNLVHRRITAEQEADNNGTLGVRTVTVAATGDFNNKAGWYMDLLAPTGANGAYVQEGERIVTPNQFQGTLLIGTTRIPESSDPCNPNGRGWIMAINPFSGGNPGSATSNSSAAPSGSAIFFDVNGDRQFNNSDKFNNLAAAGVGFVSSANNPIFVGNTMLTSFDNATTSSIQTAGSVGVLRRVSWREWVGQ